MLPIFTGLKTTPRFQLAMPELEVRELVLLEAVIP